MVAFIAEPVIGAASGAVVPPEDYFKAIREICDKYDILFIADEVMTGFGRTGSMFAMEQFGVIPDLITVAKGMSAGYIPLGGVVVKDEIWEAFKKGSGVFVHGHTYGGNPLAAAVAVAVLEVLEEENLVENSRVVGQYLLEELQQKLIHSSIVGDVRGRGLMQGVEIVKEKGSKTPFGVKLGIAEKATLKLMHHGVVVYPGNGAADGISGDHFLLAPPLIISKDQADEMVQGIATGFADLERELRSSGELS